MGDVSLSKPVFLQFERDVGGAACAWCRPVVVC
jgi:hypothetical protein